ncbi:alpha/beta hydrolase [Pseudofrankia sp. DC12]|uniref:alpha/beta hydrolase n=1 Tax=Pseudofrankia sp. DC12 TaxID=683315 RepID=UPI0005F79482|nr:alpha/beta hydrolase [Pseudofrankia sp. DC12]
MATSVDPAVGVSTQPVLPVAPPSEGSFEGFTTYSYIPVHPTGIIYLFHGSGGSADFAIKVETTDVLNEMIGRGFGYVATESTERSGDRRWNVDDPSMTSNPDLARMDRLRRHVIDSTAVDADTPTYGLGMSNGSAFTALWAAAESSAGVRISAVALYMAGPTRAVDRLGGLRVPTFMVVGVNDTVTNPAKEKADLAAIADAGLPTELHEVIQRAVTPARYLRVPGVTEATAESVVAAYQQAGIVDSAGRLLASLPAGLTGDNADSLTSGVRLPTSLTPGQQTAVNAETLATIGEHQFNAEFKVQNAQFFADQRTS